MAASVVGGRALPLTRRAPTSLQGAKEADQGCIPGAPTPGSKEQGEGNRNAPPSAAPTTGELRVAGARLVEGAAGGRAQSIGAGEVLYEGMGVRNVGGHRHHRSSRCRSSSMPACLSGPRSQACLAQARSSPASAARAGKAPKREPARRGGHLGPRLADHQEHALVFGQVDGTQRLEDTILKYCFDRLRGHR